MFAHRRHDISDKLWEKLEPHLPGRKGSWGRVAYDNRLFINAIFRILRTGAPKPITRKPQVSCFTHDDSI